MKGPKSSSPKLGCTRPCFFVRNGTLIFDGTLRYYAESLPTYDEVLAV